MLSSGGLCASRSTACCLYIACRSATTTVFGSRTNMSEKNACPTNSRRTGDTLVCQRGFTVSVTRRVSEVPTSIIKPVIFFKSTFKNPSFGTSSESGLQLVIKNARYYHITPYVYRKVEYVAGDGVRKPKLDPILKQNVVILIDEEGNNLGRMDSKMALGMADGRGLTVEHVGNQRKPVNNSPDENIPVFKMAGKTVHAESSRSIKKKSLKKTSEVVKEVHFGTKITDYDKLNKLRHVVDVIERGKSVRVFSEVRAKGKWMSSEVYEEELKKRETILDDIEEHLKGIGIREKELKARGKMIYAHFKPSPEVLQKRAEVLKEHAENKMMMKKKKWQKKEERELEKEKERASAIEEELKTKHI